MSNKPKISVIIPVYKAENYIERCAISLFEQSIQDMEYVFVDDNSPDRSIEILNDTLRRYPNRKDQVTIVSHLSNMGVGTSRQDGFNRTNGEYVIHCDPDDWVDSIMYEKLYNKAVANHVDIVICDYIMEYEHKSEIKSFNISNTDSHFLLGELVNGNLHGGLWNKLVRRNFIIENNIQFTPGLNICEDLIYCIRLMQVDPKIAYIKESLYHYDKYSNSNSLTMLSTSHNINQYYGWSAAFDEVIKDKNSKIYRTGFTYIAYWAFTHHIFSGSEYRKRYCKTLNLLFFNDRSIIIRIITILSALGLYNSLYKIYMWIKYKI